MRTGVVPVTALLALSGLWILACTPRSEEKPKEASVVEQLVGLSSTAKGDQPADREALRRTLKSNDQKIFAACVPQVEGYKSQGRACQARDLSCLEFLHERSNRATRDFDAVIDGSDCRALLTSEEFKGK